MVEISMVFKGLPACGQGWGWAGLGRGWGVACDALTDRRGRAAEPAVSNRKMPLKVKVGGHLTPWVVQEDADSLCLVGIGTLGSGPWVPLRSGCLAAGCLKSPGAHPPPRPGSLRRRPSPPGSGDTLLLLQLGAQNSCRSRWRRAWLRVPPLCKPPVLTAHGDAASCTARGAGRRRCPLPAPRPPQTALISTPSPALPPAGLPGTWG